MPYITWICELFNEAQAPYSMDDIITRLQNFYRPDISRSSVYRAHKALQLSDDEETRLVVKPIDPSVRLLLFKAAGAQRIARRAVGNKKPSKVQLDPKPQRPRRPQPEPEKVVV